ncbi:hypothetical protein G7054_g3168 [Neopestalotiopsis clavispora]|nr:hypothetical protein G7054_g3168 [Neopestalotiopsis clavispora]
MTEQRSQSTQNGVNALRPSKRALRNISHDESGLDDDLEGISYYDPIEHPDGLIDISGSSNEGMRDFLQDYCKSYAENELQLDQGNSQVYASGWPWSIVFNICDPGEGILVPVPTYSQFQRDFSDRADVRLVPVPMADYHLQFHCDHSKDFVLALEKAYKSALREGIRVKALLICNPCNPLGRCYPKETLIEIARFCGRRNLHLVSDEIYALSCFKHESHTVVDFTSVLCIPDDPTRGVVAENIHCLYGVSKDWAMGGIRLGFLVSRNEALWKACRRLALFSWVTHFSTQFWIDFMKNKDAVRRYVSLNQARLKEKSTNVSSLMKIYGIPHLEANSGLFLWLDLSNWLEYFPGTDQDGNEGETREIQLTRHLIKHGVHMSMGKECLSPDPGMYRFVFTSPGKEAFLAVERISAGLKALESRERSLKCMETNSSCGASIDWEMDEKSDGELHQPIRSKGPRKLVGKQFWMRLLSCDTQKC